jgi:hypothetical protein
MSQLFDPVPLAKAVEAFYLSGQQYSSAVVVFRPPIHDAVRFQLARRSSYGDTLDDVMARVFLYISMCMKLTYTVNGLTHTRIAVGPSHAAIVLKDINERHYKDYIHGGLTTN